jgi:hypothetical protein
MPSTGTAASNTAVSHRGAPASDTLFGPPDRMMPPLDIGDRRVERDDLGVDRQLAETARNQLRELRAEVQDDDGLVIHR